jgi:methylated-DNA-[protein]-cysteine S-methyltransferase
MLTAADPATAAAIFSTPLGSVRAEATPDGVSALTFITSAKSERCSPLCGESAPTSDSHPAHNHLALLQHELAAYFAGTLRIFTTPLAPQGTPFQHRVWNELRAIPHGETISYATLATRLADPNATRAVARANAQNPIAIFIPCHRVIGKDGTLTGYAGGLERKQALLELESTNTLFSRS